MAPSIARRQHWDLNSKPQQFSEAAFSAQSQHSQLDIAAPFYCHIRFLFLPLWCCHINSNSATLMGEGCCSHAYNLSQTGKIQKSPKQANRQTGKRSSSAKLTHSGGRRLNLTELELEQILLRFACVFTLVRDSPFCFCASHNSFFFLSFFSYDQKKVKPQLRKQHKS